MCNLAPKNAPGKGCVRDGHFGSYRVCDSLPIGGFVNSEFGSVSASGVQRSARPTSEAGFAIVGVSEIKTCQIFSSPKKFATVHFKCHYVPEYSYPVLPSENIFKNRW